MLTTVLFDMGGTLEDIWYNDETRLEVRRKLLEVLRANGLEPGCSDSEFWERLADGPQKNFHGNVPRRLWPGFTVIRCRR